MRISDKKDSRVSREGSKPSARPAEGGGAPRFVSALQRIAGNGEEFTGRLQQLKDEIDRVGDALDREPNMANFKRFRDLLTSLARTATAGAYRMEQISDTVSHKILEVMTVIDREADTLYHLIMKEQKDRIRISAQIMKLKGLVVDFLV